MGVGAQLDPQKGGAFSIDVGSDIATGEYHVVDPPHRLVMTWGWDNNPEVPPGSTTVEITLTPEGSGTLMRLRHLRLPSDAQRASHRGGWAIYLGNLQAVLSGR